MTDTYKVGIYLRLSREDEKLGESGSISTQRDLLLNYIKDNNLTYVDEYIDYGVSGTTFDRDGFNRMIKDCESKKINMVITKDTSRLGRDHIEFGYYVERYFPEHNIRYVAVNDGIDTFNTNNSLNDMLVFKSAFNDLYVKDISNKLKSSLYTKKKNGLFVGCYAPFGYKKCENDNHKLEVDDRESKIVKRIFKLFVDGNSISKISTILSMEHVPTPSMLKNMNLGQSNVHFGIWSSRTIENILKNPTYIGNLTQGRQKKINYKSKKRINNKSNEWIIALNSIDPIIDDNTFKIAQDIFKSNKNRGTKGNGITGKLLLRGLVFCKECHHTIGFADHVQKTKKRGLVHRIYGNCNYWQKRKKQNVCTPHSIKYQILEDTILKCIKDVTKVESNKDYLINYFKNNNKKIRDKNSIRQEIFRLNQIIENDNKKIDICYNDKLNGIITLDRYKRIYDSLMIEINETLNKKELWEEKFSNINNDDNYLEEINKVYSLDNPNRSLISMLIDNIEIDEDNNIDIFFKFKKNKTLISNSCYSCLE